MEKIIQLKESEYNKLIEDATLTSKLIERRAAILYEENGTHKFQLTMNIGDYDDKIEVQARGYYNDWKSKYPISTTDAKKVVKFMEHRAEELFEGAFGSAIYEISKFREATRSLEERKKLLTLITYLGWFVALVMFGFIVFKK